MQPTAKASADYSRNEEKRGQIYFPIENCRLDSDPCFVALGNTEAARCRRYEDCVRQAIPVDELKLIRDSLQRGQLTGTNRFIDEVEGIVGLRIEQRGQGRPRVEHDK